MIRYRNMETFLVAILGGTFLSIIYVNPYEGCIALSELILQLSGSRGTFAMGTSMLGIVGFSMRMVPYYVFEVYMGISLYRHFCTASIYVFARCTKRINWYLKEVAIIGGMALSLQMLLLISAIVTSTFRYHVFVDKAGIMLMIYHFILYALWVYSMSLIINFLALYCGSSRSFLLSMVIQTIGVTCLRLEELIVNGLGITIGEKGAVIKYNLIAHLVLGWQSSRNTVLSKILIEGYEGLDINVSVLIMMIFAILVTVVGGRIVKKQDFLISDLEIGAA